MAGSGQKTIGFDGYCNEMSIGVALFDPWEGP
jgi:hypothetical protein